MDKDVSKERPFCDWVFTAATFSSSKFRYQIPYVTNLADLELLIHVRIATAESQRGSCLPSHADHFPPHQPLFTAFSCLHEGFHWPRESVPTASDARVSDVRERNRSRSLTALLLGGASYELLGLEEHESARVIHPARARSSPSCMK